MEGRPQYLIHACKKREWYVHDFLIPEMVEQGIPREDIEVYMDENNDGCLMSFIKSIKKHCTTEGGRWHLQDDVCISSDFAEKTKKYDEGVVCGFVRFEWQSLQVTAGHVPAIYMWNSFPCIRIPDKLAMDCVDWILNDAMYRDIYREWVENNRHDDQFWYDYIYENHMDMFITNLNPNIVEHIDVLIGGSAINRWRDYWARADLWQDEEALNKMQDKLERRNSRSFL